MKPLPTLALLALTLIAAACSHTSTAVAESPTAHSLDFDYTRVSGPLESLTNADRKTVEDTIQLMKSGQHRLAYARLSAINQSNPSNASVRLLGSYALLQLGNLAESLAEAQRAHDANGHGVYQCYVLSRVAALNGNQELARSEAEHVNGSGDETLKRALAAAANNTSAN